MNKINYMIIAIAVAVLIIGFILMAGGKNISEYNPDIFSFRRITIAPTICVIGFILVIVGIMYKQKK